jgi:outer membrane lipoprotein-sorting protein
MLICEYRRALSINIYQADRHMKPILVKTAILSLLMASLSRFVMGAPVDSKELAQLLKFYAPIQALTVSFQQTKHLHEMGLELRSSGRLEIHRPDQIVWEILKPSHLWVSIDKEKFRLKEGDGAEQVFELNQLSQENAARGVGLLKPWLLLDVKALSEQYAVEKVRPGFYVFTPKSDVKFFKAMDVTIGKAGHMEKMLLHEPSGDTLEIAFGTPKVVK